MNLPCMDDCPRLLAWFGLWRGIFFTGFVSSTHDQEWQILTKLSLNTKDPKSQFHCVIGNSNVSPVEVCDCHLCSVDMLPLASATLYLGLCYFWGFLGFGGEDQKWKEPTCRTHSNLPPVAGCNLIFWIVLKGRLDFAPSLHTLGAQ